MFESKAYNCYLKNQSVSKNTLFTITNIRFTLFKELIAVSMTNIGSAHVQYVVQIGK
jgi:hypothetical protein